MHRKLSEEEAKLLRTKPILAEDEHFVMRYMFRASFEKAKEVIMEGDIYKEGRNKYRAVLPRKGKLMFVIFHDEGDYLEPKTIGITSSGKMKWG